MADLKKDLPGLLRTAAEQIRKLATLEKRGALLDLKKLKGLLNAGKRKNAA